MAKAKRQIRKQSTTGTGRPKRQLAPRQVSVQSLSRSNDREDIANKYKKDGLHMFYGDREKVKYYVEDGYTPVMEDGQQVHHKGDPLFSIPEAEHVARREVSELESVAILEQARLGQRSEDTIRDSSGDVHRVTVEQTIE